MANYWLRYEGTRFPVRRGETLIGRSAYCSIVISDPSVSREHAALRMGGDVIEIVDLGSRNGTFVNGERVKEGRALSPGDTIVLGRALMQILAVDEVPRARMHTTGMLAVGDPEESFEDPTTQTQPVTLALIETLVGRAAGTSGSVEIAGAIRSAIDALLLHAKRQSKPLEKAEAERLAVTAGTIATWVADGSLDEWRVEVTKQLGIEST